MVEVIFAIMILAVGLMGMAGTTALVVRQVTMADLATERSAALQTTIERLQALPFDQLTDGSDSVGIFDATWTVTNPTGQWASVEIVTTGPGLASREGGFPMLLNSVPDTFIHRILR
jgi:Tfp pilus assembly protein PilV